jgi:hypothetical protein
MITIETVAEVSKEGELLVKLPSTVPPGEHRVIIVVDAPKQEKNAQPLEFSVYPVGLLSNTTFRREDIYGDDER